LKTGSRTDFCTIESIVLLKDLVKIVSVLLARNLIFHTGVKTKLLWMKLMADD
jgi:hypothetical protein